VLTTLALSLPISDRAGAAILGVCGIAALAAAGVYCLKKCLPRRYYTGHLQAREQTHSKLIRNYRQSLDTSPDYRDLIELQSQLKRLNTKAAQEMLVEVDGLLEIARRDAEATALEDAGNKIRQIRARIDPENAEIPDDRVFGD
jgi:hypothetical protein